ncbi:MAG TPA: MFS transporter [Methanocorpusculum sp.]|nr:MFS transporter [Methanocorpusculum sp.]
MDLSTAPLPKRTTQILVVVGAILLYGIIAGIRANASLLSSLISATTGIAYGNVSLAFSIMNLIMACSIPLIAILTLKVRYAYLFFIGIITAAIGFFGTAGATTTAGIIVFLGIFFGIGASVLSFSIVYSAAKPFFGEKGSAILSGVLLAAQGAMGVCVSSFIGTTSETFGLKLSLILISAVIACLIPFTFIFRKRRTDPAPTTADETREKVKLTTVFRKMLTTPFLYMLLLGFIAFGMGDGFLVNHLSQGVYVIYGADETAQSFLVSVYAVSVMAGALSGGLIAARARNRALTLSIIFLIWVGINMGLRVLVDYYLDTGFFTPVLLSVILFLGGFLLNATNVLLIALIGEHVSAAFSVLIIGLFDALGFLIYAINQLMGGILFDIYGNFRTLVTIVFFLCCAAGILFLIYGIRQRKKEPKIYF